MFVECRCLTEIRTQTLYCNMIKCFHIVFPSTRSVSLVILARILSVKQKIFVDVMSIVLFVYMLT